MTKTTPSPALPTPAWDEGPCALYLHIPFCETKCGYCDFYSVAVKDQETAPLVTWVVRELTRRVRDKPGPIRTIFCGGGTPTILPEDQLALLLDGLRPVATADSVVEFTVEANPATVDDAKARLLIAGGVTRVSMGAQSFLADELAALERLHRPEDIVPSVATLRRHGIQQVNLDLIFGIPGQTSETWRQSLQRAIDLQPEHIACYGLTYEPGTRLTAMRDHGRVSACDESLEADMYLQAIEVLTAAGFEQYEISNFARPGCQCAHNLIYWRNQPYIGVGPSAAGCFQRRRYKNVADVAGYVRMMESQGHAEADTETLTVEMLMAELVMMQLRLVEGLGLDRFCRRTGIEPQTLFGDVLPRFADAGLLTISPTHIALTRKGFLVADAVIRDLVAVCGAAQHPVRKTL